MISVMAEDAEEAARKLDHKDFFGNVVHVEVAKPKKRSILKEMNVNRREGFRRRRGIEEGTREGRGFRREAGGAFESCAHDCGIRHQSAYELYHSFP